MLRRLSFDGLVGFEIFTALPIGVLGSGCLLMRFAALLDALELEERNDLAVAGSGLFASGRG